MYLQTGIRAILGIVFAALGYFISGEILEIIKISDPTASFLLKIVSMILAGGFGIFTFPVISRTVRDWSAAFARRVATEVISQLHLPSMPTIPTIKRKPKPKEKEKEYINPVVVDTSALIDGRIADVVESGFFYGTLVVPRFVLSELHHIADAPDALRRGKGRRGLEVLEILRKSKWSKTLLYKADNLEGKDIDDKIVELAKNIKAKILTTDFNLNKVATVSGVKILNINELVNVLKTTLLPGENLEVKIIQEGKEKGQGVGYLRDGTMIVVENGANSIGKTVPTTVSRVLQTVAGRMIFVQAEGADQSQESTKQTNKAS